jgi:Leucine-rich repeat (LRR) protein
MQNKPIIFLAFANDKVDTARYLRNLPREMDGIRKALQRAVQAELCEVIERANVTVENILDIFQDANYKDRIAIFHYGGHADGYQLLLEQTDGTHAVAQGEGLVFFFSKQKGLKLVFFNGCSTQQQSLELVAAGVPAVIGTSNAINDDIATELSIRFYKAIGNGASIERAWNETIDQVKIQQGVANLRGLYRKQEKELIADRFPWEIWWREGAEITKNWNLPETVDNPLFGLPEITQTHLPEKPYRFLERYHKEDAEIFFGRSYYIRELYNRATDKNSAPVTLLYGQSGVGKSSLLDAGLLPRLQQVAEVCYIRRDPALGLLGTFKKALGIPPLSSGQESGVAQNTPLSSGEGLGVGQNQNILTDSQNNITDSSISIIDKQIELIKQALSLTEKEEKQTLKFIIQTLEQKRQIIYSKNVYTYQKDITLYQKETTNLLKIWKSKENEKPFIVLLDQAEECFTKINPDLPNELENFLAEVQNLFADPQNQPKGKLILSYRKEYHPEIKEIFKTFSIPREEIFLKSLSQKDIVEIVKGLTMTDKLRRTYRLTVEETLPAIVADDLLEDKESPIAPVLQILLTKMWQLSEQEELRYFSVKKYQELKQQGILMDDFFQEQMSLLEKHFPELMKVGLPLEILNYHTTKLGTADTKSLEELRERYKDRQEVTEQLIQLCKDLYLLSDVSQQKTGLAHDTLAPIIQREFRKSDKVGQRATIILDNKMLTYLQNSSTYIDVDDLQIVEQGKSGMKYWTKKEEELINKSRERKKALEEKDKKVKRQKNILFTSIAVIGVISLLLAVFAFLQYKDANLQKQSAEANFFKANKLVGAFYFAYDKFALAFKDTKFYFINKNGEKVEKLGEWDNAEQFEIGTDFAKVKRRGVNFLLDTLGNSYQVAYDIKELSKEVTALDLMGKEIQTFPIEILAYPQLEVLNLAGNQFEHLPSEIKYLRKLKILNLRSCLLPVLPAEIGALENLINLNLNENSFISLPAEIGKLKHLQELNLANNPLTTLPSQIGELKNLTFLYLAATSLQTLPAQFEALDSLKTLDLTNMGLKVLPKEITGLKNLENLDLGANQFTSLPAEIDKLSKLKKLSVSYNSLTALPAEIGALNQLVALDLSSNQLIALPKAIGKLVNLKVLNVTGNQLTTLPKEIGALKNLITLQLNNNLINQLPVSLSDLENLQNLNLYNNKLTTIGSEINGLNKLAVLELNSNQLTTLPTAIKNLENLQELNVGFNQLSSIPAEIGKLKNLKTLFLSNNQLQNIPNEIGDMEKLDDLLLNENKLKELPSTIGKLQNLKNLFVISNQLETLPNKIGGLAHIETLFLNNNQLKKLPHELWGLKNLMTLDLMDNKDLDLKDSYKALAVLPVNLVLSTSPNGYGIDTLSLFVKINIQNALLAEIANVKNIQKLDFERDSLTDLPPAIGELKSLSEINLRGSKNVDWAEALVILAKTGKEIRFTTENGKTIEKGVLWVVVGADNTLLKLLMLNLPSASYQELGKVDYLYLGALGLSTLPKEISQLKGLKTINLSGNNFSAQEKERIKQLLPTVELIF